MAPAVPSLGGVGRDFVSSARVSAFGTRKSYGFSEGPGVHVNNIAYNAANLSENVAVKWSERASRNCRVNGAGAAVRINTVGTTASATSGNKRGIAGARAIRNNFTNAAANAQCVRAKFVSTAAGVQATRVDLIGTIAISRQSGFWQQRCAGAQKPRFY